MKRAQVGASGLFVAIILLLVAATTLAVLALSSSNTQVERNTQVSNNLKRLQLGLLQFVSTNGYLPCPANPTLDTGDPDPAVPSATCNSLQGTVPWKAIGARKEDSVDPWGGKISYRVYQGLTQLNGASMVDCLTPDGNSSSRDASGLCPSAHDTTESTFLAGKGLDITAFGAPPSKAAYVLISHGPTGLGSYTSTGTQRSLPIGGDESSNLNAAGPFVAKAASAANIDVSDVNHFDDIVAFAEIGALIRDAGRGGRAWSDSSMRRVVFNASTLTTALGSAPTPGVLVGVNTIVTGGITTRALSGGVAQDFVYDDTPGMEGVGVSGAGSTSIKIALTSKAQKFAFTAGKFGSGVDAFMTPYAEQVKLDFFDGSTNVLTVFKTACNPDPALASFAVDVAVDYDNLEITPQFAVGAFVDSPFLLSAIAACPAAAISCATSLSAPSNACP